MIKQVIVIRKDLRNTKGDRPKQGKIASQASHATIAWMVNRLRSNWNSRVRVSSLFSETEMGWFETGQAKIVLAVDDEAQLITCISIAPTHAERVDLITGHLKLY